MRIRTLTTIVAVAIMIPLLIYSGTYVFVAAVAFFAVVAMFEMMRCLGIHRRWGIVLPLYGIAGVMPFAARLIGRIPSFGSFFLYVMMTYLLYLFALTVLSHGTLRVTQAAEVFSLGCYIALAFSAIVVLRDHGDTGKYLYILIFIASWVTDIFAYLCGRLFGRHKLIPDVSPHKTVEGSVGGILFCTLAFVGYGAVSAAIGEAEPNYVFLAIAGIILSVCAQIGDLIASVIKREHGIKDYGKLFPGHGGVMDRFDSTLAVATVLLVLAALPELWLL